MPLQQSSQSPLDRCCYMLALLDMVRTLLLHQVNRTGWLSKFRRPYQGLGRHSHGCKPRTQSYRYSEFLQLHMQQACLLPRRRHGLVDMASKTSSLGERVFPCYRE